ncbi:MAG: hypothetical protein QOD60_457 [Solirubrobacterales bacterium]|jgi:hypothetical protein|nr:hypothetical protein [Solirubrobacterales bacterium]
MPERIDGGTVFAVIGGALLLVSLFLNWYVAPGVAPAPDVAVGNAWDVFESLDLILAAIAAGSIYLAYAQATGGLASSRAWMLPLGIAGLAIVGSQILNPPPVVSPPVTAPGTVGPDPAIGAWLALAGSVGLFVGGVLSRASVSFSVNFDSAEATR